MLFWGILLGGAMAVVLYETYYERKEKNVSKILAPKLEKLIEKSSMKIAIRQKKLNRELTMEEKDKILDECYNEM